MSTSLALPAKPSAAGQKPMLEAIKGKLSHVNQMLLLAILASAVACVLVLFLWSGSQGYRPLYGLKEKVDSSQIIEVLEGEGIDYRLEANSGQILVAENKLSSARLLLAAKGVQAQLPEGLENLAKAPIGTSQFMEHARYLHGLEGELARTIMALEAVRYARVHLAIPKRTLFIRAEPEKPTASVLLELYSGARLDESQVSAIANLVSGSITGMTPAQVQIVDQAGNYLNADMASGQDISQSRSKQLKYTHELENNLIARAESMLNPILGRDNYQVQLVARVNFNQIEETRESVDPNPVMTQETLNKDQTNGNLALGIPGALSNKPVSGKKGKKEDNQESSLRQQETRSYEVGRSVRHTKFQQMQLEGLSVAILLNQQAAGKEGWQPQQLQQISDMVKDAIGFSEARGDQININSFDFVVPEKPVIEALPWWQNEHLHEYLKYGIGTLLALLLILFVLRPLVQHLTRGDSGSRHSGNKAGDKTAEMALEAEPLTQAIEPPQLALQAEDSKALPQSNLPPPGSPLTVKMQHLGLLATEEPARVAEVISHWMKDKNRD
ncbi:flagellar basal-body MS-ring/collar protein FliF [Shewanella algae]|uniref:flagellar basal-body MS-ring/collar protein FliF n=1 Tax=Shewanella algae TaxID=38313 RepID=UPI0011875B59|nr:flagellar basal-body MS-ring/collar protein FliF [Shewanella algae]TVP00784.1 flagellar M-ring protein FliF [Shewanella algae]